MLRLALLFTLLCLCRSDTAAQGAAALIPYADSAKWGYCNPAGKIIIVPQWDDAWPFQHNRALVEIDTGPYEDDIEGMMTHRFIHCIIDRNGRYIIPPSRQWSGTHDQPWAGRHLNAQNGRGGWGLIDTANREIIPCLYDRPEQDERGYNKSGYFYFDKAFNRYAAVVKKGGRTGIIDTANRVLVPFSDVDEFKEPAHFRDPIPLNYYIVIKAGRKGIIDTAGKIIIPCAYDHIWFENPDFYKGMDLDSGNRRIHVNIDGSRPLIMPGYSVQYGTDGYYGIRDRLGRYGIINRDKAFVFPCSYSWAYVEKGVIALYRDSLYAAAGESAATYHGSHRWYSTATLQPLTGWADDTHQEPFPATPAPARRMEEAGSNPMRIAGDEMRYWLKDGIRWRYTGFTHWPGGYQAVSGMAQGPDSTVYAAMLDTTGAYFLKPHPSGDFIVGYDAVNRWMTLQTRDSAGYTAYAVVSRSWKTVIAAQRGRIAGSFSWKGKAFALADAVQINPWKYQYRNVRGLIVIGSDGQPYEALAGYAITELTDRYGMPPGGRSPFAGPVFGHPFAGYFLASDGYRQGIVNMAGKVQYPAVSFSSKAYSFRPVGEGYFLIDRQGHYRESGGGLHGDVVMPKRIEGYSLVDTAGRDLFPGLPVFEVNPVYGSDDGRIPVLYRVCYWHGDDPYTRFYMSRAGKGYFGKLQPYEPLPH